MEMDAKANGQSNKHHIGERTTRRGKVFGSHRQHCLDYIGLDFRSARRARGGMLHEPGLPGDHAMVGVELDLGDRNWNKDELTRRAQAKPIGWHINWEEKQVEWDMLTSKWSDDWTPAWTMQAMTQRLQEQAHMGQGTRPRWMLARRSPTMVNMENELRREDDPDRRQIIKKKMWDLGEKSARGERRSRWHMFFETCEKADGGQALQEKVADMNACASTTRTS